MSNTIPFGIPPSKPAIADMDQRIEEFQAFQSMPDNAIIKKYGLPKMNVHELAHAKQVINAVLHHRLTADHYFVDKLGMSIVEFVVWCQTSKMDAKFQDAHILEQMGENYVPVGSVLECKDQQGNMYAVEICEYIVTLTGIAILGLFVFYKSEAMPQSIVSMSTVDFRGVIADWINAGKVTHPALPQNDVIKYLMTKNFSKSV